MRIEPHPVVAVGVEGVRLRVVGLHVPEGFEGLGFRVQWFRVEEGCTI